MVGEVNENGGRKEKASTRQYDAYIYVCPAFIHNNNHWRRQDDCSSMNYIIAPPPPITRQKIERVELLTPLLTYILEKTWNNAQISSEETGHKAAQLFLHAKLLTTCGTP